jgi:hypothetical protein
MYRKIWKDYNHVICSIEFYGKTGSRILGLTGFRHGNKIITDDQIYSIEDPDEIKIRFYEEDGNRVRKEIVFSGAEFQKLLPQKSEFENLGFAYFNLNEDHLDGTVSLNLCQNCNTAIGTQAVTISYNYNQNNIALKSALVSSNIINERGLSYLQFDGSVRPGTSGSPLMDLESGKVLGIVANKELQIVKTYREILKNVDKNLIVLEKVKDKWFVEDVDPVQVLIVNQLQIKHLSREFFTNFAIKAGYALDVNHLREYFESFSDVDIDREKNNQD